MLKPLNLIMNIKTSPGSINLLYFDSFPLMHNCECKCNHPPQGMETKDEKKIIMVFFQKIMKVKKNIYITLVFIENINIKQF